MEQIFKIFVIQNEPYLTVDEDVIIGDKVIVTVGDEFPTLVECKNEDQINLFQKPKTTLTKRHKVVLTPDVLNLDDNILSVLSDTEGPLIVKYINGEVKLNN